MTRPVRLSTLPPEVRQTIRLMIQADAEARAAAEAKAAAAATKAAKADR